MTMFFAGFGTNQKIIILSCDSRSYSLGIFAIQKIRGCFAWNELGDEVLLTHFAKNILLLRLPIKRKKVNHIQTEKSAGYVNLNNS